MVTQMGGREMRVLFFIMRRTYGFNITSAMFTVGTIANYVGIDPSAASRALNRLIARKIVSRLKNGYFTINEPSRWLTTEPRETVAVGCNIVESDNIPCAEFGGDGWKNSGEADMSETTDSECINNDLKENTECNVNKRKATRDEYATSLANLVIAHYKARYRDTYGAERPVPLSAGERRAAEAEIVRRVKDSPGFYNYCFFVTLINCNIEGRRSLLQEMLTIKPIVRHVYVWRRIRKKKGCQPGVCLSRT
jgi:phage replication O-like protein O